MKTIHSMTGYGEGIWTSREGTYTIVAKSLNHRFLEIRVKLPPSYDSWDSEIQKKIKELFDRGRIDVVISEMPGETGKALPRVDMELASRYVEMLTSLKKELSLAGEISIDTVCRMRDVIYQADSHSNVADLWGEFEVVLNTVLVKLKEDRAREGDALSIDLRQRLSVISRIAEDIRELSPQAVSRFRERLTTKLKELSDDRLNVDRLEEEVVIFVDRIDFTEELVRLTSHISGFSDALKEGSPVGRKLDFLLQEMGREINTIGSKNANDKITPWVVTAKVELEKMRQQVQNIE